ncbi:putative DsbA family dithiol-disulfide isomerase [Nocardiopsis sp. Huas11]|uniref:DsbA family oxidoreductase n=1 Tax=Nocardiopsis sp. Huas11 TaxID=2183912 RepID=UPI000EB53C4C|nr:DsbA family oxidoreductase [Nocardiopsis sp. Huas11]RKS08854.1 putative DsbA family dithiol-disulfide isomerase [Nocardiopsis sp. Huas11]
MRVDVWSDIVCPWCFIGKRRLEAALERFDHAGQVELVWHSYQLDPGFPRGRSEPVYASLAARMRASTEQVRAMTEQVAQVAAKEGLDYDLAGALMVNTLDSHRLVHLARERGLDGAVMDRLLLAQLVQARDLSDAETLVELVAQVGVDAGAARRVLRGEDFTEQVAQEAEQARRLGATGVPFFVMDGAFGVSGAQPVEAFVSALDKAYAAAHG